MSSSGAQVRVCFVTKYEEFRVVDAPFAVPLKLGRNGLSEVVNHLLELSEPQAFDFAINSKLVRVPLHKFIQNNNLSVEQIITIEYFPATSFSDESESMELPSWIGSMDTKDNIVAAACYDGQIKLYLSEETIVEIGSIQAHEDPVRAVKFVEQKGAEDNKYVLATGSKDMTVKLWRIEVTETKAKKGASSTVTAAATLLATFEAHIASVESLSVWYQEKNKATLLSGDWNGTIFAWNLTDVLSGKATSETAQPDKKKRRKGSEGDVTTAQGPIVVKKPVFTIKAHGQSVSGLSAVHTQHAVVISCSHDHSMKVWDLTRQDCVATMACSKVFTSLDWNMKDSVITSHPDGRARLWRYHPGAGEVLLGANDATVNNAALLASFGKTVNWINQVRWLPSPNLFAAVDYAGQVCVWDVRAANVPIGRSEAHEGKVLCVSWAKKDEDEDKEGENGRTAIRVLSGGSDCVLKSALLTSFGDQHDNNGESMEE